MLGVESVLPFGKVSRTPNRFLLCLSASVYLLIVEFQAMVGDGLSILSRVGSVEWRLSNRSCQSFQFLTCAFPSFSAKRHRLIVSGGGWQWVVVQGASIVEVNPRTVVPRWSVIECDRQLVSSDCQRLSAINPPRCPNE